MKMGMVVMVEKVRERKVTLIFIKKTGDGDDNKVNNKTEEHLSSAGSIVYSESIGNNSVQLSAHEEIATSYERNIQEKGRYTDEDNKEELDVAGDNTNNYDDGKISRKMTLVRTILSCLMTLTMG